MATLVTRRLCANFSIDTLRALWHGLEAEGYDPQCIYLLGADFSRYMHLLTGLSGYWARDAEEPSDENAVRFNGARIFPFRCWPVGTIGFLVAGEER